MSDPRDVSLVTRSVADGDRDGQPVRIVRIARTYAATPDETWDALTRPERLPRWFAPVTGDFRRGGTYAVEGNASGEILACEPPGLLDLTWVFGDQVSWVTITLTPVPGGTRVLLAHAAPAVESAFWDQFGPGATGVGWDLAAMGLVTHLDGGPDLDPDLVATWHTTPEGVAFITAAADAWGDAARAWGMDEAMSSAQVDAVRGFYLGLTPPDDAGQA